MAGTDEYPYLGRVALAYRSSGATPEVGTEAYEEWKRSLADTQGGNTQGNQGNTQGGNTQGGSVFEELGNFLRDLSGGRQGADTGRDLGQGNQGNQGNTQGGNTNTFQGPPMQQPAPQAKTDYTVPVLLVVGALGAFAISRAK